MDEAPTPGIAPQKRGRPRKYATVQDKADADVKRKRAKRQQVVSAQWDERFTTAYSPCLPSALPPLPRDDDTPTFCQRNDDRGNDHQRVQAPMTHDNDGFHDQDISHYLPPPNSPPLPSAQGLPFEENETIIGERAGSPTLDGAVSDGDNENNTEAPLTSGNIADQDPLSLLDGDHETPLLDVDRLAARLTDQLVAFRGCCTDCHEHSRASHYRDFEEHTSLNSYLESTRGLCPDILGDARIASTSDDLAGKTDASSRRRIFCGIGPRDTAPHICLGEDERVTDEAAVSFDVDSITGFPTSLAVAKQGIRWHPTQMPVSDLQSDLHLTPRQVQFVDSSGKLHRVHRPVHQIPHYTFGRIIGFEDISLYILFPRLYRAEQQCSRLRDEDFRLWMDGVVLPIVHEHYSSAYVQHYPSSYDHSRFNATARGVEARSQRVDPVVREQQLAHYLPPESLGEVWEAMIAATQKPSFQHFADIAILLQAKNLKVLTKEITWEQAWKSIV